MRLDPRQITHPKRSHLNGHVMLFSPVLMQKYSTRNPNPVLRKDEAFELEVVDLAKDPLATGPFARSTTENSSLEKALWF